MVKVVCANGREMNLPGKNFVLKPDIGVFVIASPAGNPIMLPVCNVYCIGICDEPGCCFL